MNKTERFRFWLSAEDRSNIARRAKANGQSMAAFIRTQLNEGKVEVIPSIRLDHWGQLCAIGAEVNEATRIANQTGVAPESLPATLAKLHALLLKIRANIQAVRDSRRV